MFPFERHLSTHRRLQRLLVMIALIFVAIAPSDSAQVIPTAGQLQMNGAITIVFTADSVSCSELPPGDKVALVGSNYSWTRTGEASGLRTLRQTVLTSSTQRMDDPQLMKMGRSMDPCGSRWGRFDQSQNSVCLFVVDDRTLEFRMFYLQFAHSPVSPRGGC